ncbi:MAG: hypothetical protein OXH76_17290 [Boseongicola sp.]|nr:hypothetical protein [Boseongicola sp.]MYH59848.1 hypothetical protein [Boseongicola sp. SB0675_bin_26]
MAYSTQFHDHGVAGFVRGSGIARPDLKVGVARMREAPETGHSEFDPGFSESCFGHVRSELSRRRRIVTALALVQVAT